MTCLAAYLIEYLPSHMDLRLQVNHPLYGLAWIGVGELLAISNHGRAGENLFGQPLRESSAAGRAAIAALPFAMAQTGAPAFLTADPSASRLTSLPNGVVQKPRGLDRSRRLTGAVSATCCPCC